MPSPPSEQIFHACEHRFRRVGLRTLCEHESCTIEDVIDAIVEATGHVFESVRIQCYHTHFPKLAAEGIISYDWDDDIVQINPDIDPERLQRFLDDANRQMIHPV